MRRHSKGPWVAVRVAAIVALVAAALPLTAAQPAEAHSCPGGRRVAFTHYQGVARVDLTFYPECSDNRSHWHATIYDTLCDGREARLSLVANLVAFGGYQWSDGGSAGNGCGSSATDFGTQSSVVDFRPTNWVVRVQILACSWRCSDADERYITA